MYIAALWMYPVKSCAGLSVPSAMLTDKGLAHDRAWMVVDAQGEMLTQRELPRMALIQPQLQTESASHESDATLLTLHAPGMAPIRVTPPQVLMQQPKSVVRVWDDAVPAFDAGAGVSAWLTQYLMPTPRPDIPGPLRLVCFDESHARPSSARWTQGHVALNRFSDGFSLLVVSQASLDELNQRLQAQGHAAVDMRRFRPNIVLDSADGLPHDEDRVEHFQIRAQNQKSNQKAPQDDAPDVILRPVKPCPRCPIPNIDPDTAESDASVSAVLQSYRQDARLNGAITFGMNALVQQGAGQTVQVGQAVQAPWAF